MPVLPAFDPLCLPGARFTVAMGALPTALSAECRALEVRSGGRWADLSILAPGSRTTLRAALRRTRSFALDLRLLDDAQGRTLYLRCAGHWDPAEHEHRCQLADISDLQVARAATDERLQLLQEMVDGLPLLVLQFDTGPELRCAFAAGALLSALVPPGHQPVGQDVAGAFGPKLAAHLQQQVRAAGQGPGVQPFTWRVHDGEGRERVLEGSLRSLVDEEQRPAGHLIDALETTAYHETMAALTASETRLRRFVAASSDGIVVHVDQRIVDANPAACRLLGSSAAALRDRFCEDLIAPEQLADYQAYADAESHEAHQCCLIDSSGARIPVELIGRTVYRQGRRMRMAIVRDVRDQREAQARILELIKHLRAQKERAEAADRAKSLFLSAASHDLRQPIHAFGLFLTSLEALVREARPSQAVLDELTQRMGASLNALSRLLNSLLDVSRLDANAVVVHPVPVSLGTLFAELDADLGDSARAKGLQLNVVQTDAWAYTDPVVLRRILDNLVSNAIRYTQRGRVLVGARLRGEQVEIQVWDSGVGIAADQLEAIFGEFYQVSPGGMPEGGLRGLGLGLSIVQRSAKLLHARLQVRSAPGRGSVFSISVPRTAPAPTFAAAPAPAARPVRSSSAPRRVLVIDDDEQVLQAMQQLLQAWGHEVWCAADPDTAIVLAITHADEIDLVLSDYHLGGEIDATQFIDAVRACLVRPVPVHVFTADTSMPVAQKIRALGLSLLHKPVRHDDLQQVLEEAGP